MRTARLLFVIYLLGAVFTGCAAPGRSVNPAQQEELRRRINSEKTITILPPVLQYFKRTNLGNEPMPEFNEMVDENVMLGLRTAMSEMNFTFRPVNITDELLLQDQDLALDLTHVRNDFSKALGVMSRSRGDVEIRFSPTVNVFAERAQADLILMAQGYGFETSGGKKTKDAITAGIGAVFGYLPRVQFTATQLIVFVIDGVTGDLLWFNYNPDSDTSYNAKDRSDMEKLTFRLLEPLLM